MGRNGDAVCIAERLLQAVPDDLPLIFMSIREEAAGHNPQNLILPSKRTSLSRLISGWLLIPFE
jgi:hypothetical protein